MGNPLKPAIQRARNGEEKLWKIWWLFGLPVGWTTSALTVCAEAFRSAGYGGWAALLDVVKLLLYIFWFQLAWRCSRNVENWVWTPLSRFALSVGLVLVVMF